MNSPIRLLICGGGQGWEYAGIAAVHFQQLKTSSVFYIYFLDECLMRYPQKEKEIKTRKKKEKKEGEGVPGVVGVDDPYPLPQ